MKVFLKMNICRICRGKVLGVNGVSIHCRHIQYKDYPLAKTTDKQSKLFATVLYSCGRRLSNREIAELIWDHPDDSPLALRNVLSVMAHHIRTELHKKGIPIVLQSGEQRGWCVLVH